MSTAKCSQQNCRIAETGICLDGREDDCPHLTRGDTVDQAGAKGPEESAIGSQSSAADALFHTGEKLTVSEASVLMAERGGRVVFCAGARRSGKTTFLARIGEMFRAGTFAKYLFAGSSSLCAFERATWKATITSGASTPDTDRTERRENDTFLHLRVSSVEDRCRCHDIYISDLAGETFPVAVGSGEAYAGLLALARADCLVMFLDCERLADRRQRQAEWDNVSMFLRRASAAKPPMKILHVQVVFSRWDFIAGSPDEAKHATFCQTIEKDLKRRFAKEFDSFTFEQISARPETGPPTNERIQAMFELWLEMPLSRALAAQPRGRHPARDFSAFGLK